MPRFEVGRRARKGTQLNLKVEALLTSTEKTD
jgi:hypothetical protein